MLLIFDFESILDDGIFKTILRTFKTGILKSTIAINKETNKF
jgi:hypothetical protein